MVRMRRAASLLALLILLAAPQAAARQVVSGTVVDAARGDALPAASVQVAGTYQGTITNAEGAFALRLDTLPATLIVRYIGYQTARVDVTRAPAGRLDVRLAPVTYVLGELVVTGEDPALGIMRKVIARKQQWRAGLATYRAEAYNRFTLRNDTGIVSIIESLSQAFWDKKRGTREIVKAKRQTSNLRLDRFLPAALFVANLYDDDVEVAGHTLMGVTHPDALRHYTFRLAGTRLRDDHLVYDIDVKPRSKLKSGFEGRVSVLDDAYALIDVALRPGEAFLFPPPIERFDVTYRQQFSDFGRDVWLPVDFRADVDLKINAAGLVVFPLIRLNQVSRLTNYAINVPLPDSLFTGHRMLAVDSNAVKLDAPLREVGAVVPLTGAETLAYASIDSTMSLRKIYQPQGPVGRLMRARAEAEGRRDDGLGLRDRLDLRFAPRLWFNRVDAFHAGFELKSTPAERIRLRGEGGYSTGPAGRARWSYGGGASLLWGVDLQGEVGFDYDVANASRYCTDLYPPFFNSLHMLFGGADYFDYFRNERFTARAGYELLALQTTLSVTYRDERHTSLPKATDYDLLGRSEPLRPNPSIEAGRLRSVGVAVVYAQDEALLSFFGRRRVEVSIEHSANDVLASDFGFTRYALAADWRFDTFFQRRALPNALDVRLAAATFSGALPLQRFGIVDGRLGPYTPFGALKTLSGQPYEGEQHVALYWEHNFRTVPFEALGLRALAERGYNLVLHGAHGRTWVSDARRSALRATLDYEPNLSDGFHHELGLSLSGLFGVLRVDVAKRLDAGGFSVGLSSARVF